MTLDGGCAPKIGTLRHHTSRGVRFGYLVASDLGGKAASLSERSTRRKHSSWGVETFQSSIERGVLPTEVPKKVNSFNFPVARDSGGQGLAQVEQLETFGRSCHYISGDILPSEARGKGRFTAGCRNAGCGQILPADLAQSLET